MIDWNSRFLYFWRALNTKLDILFLKKKTFNMMLYRTKLGSQKWIYLYQNACQILLRGNQSTSKHTLGWWSVEGILYNRTGESPIERQETFSSRIFDTRSIHFLGCHQISRVASFWKFFPKNEIKNSISRTLKVFDLNHSQLYYQGILEKFV